MRPWNQLLGFNNWFEALTVNFTTNTANPLSKQLVEAVTEIYRLFNQLTVSCLIDSKYCWSKSKLQHESVIYLYILIKLVNLV